MYFTKKTVIIKKKNNSPALHSVSLIIKKTVIIKELSYQQKHNEMSLTKTQCFSLPLATTFEFVVPPKKSNPLLKLQEWHIADNGCEIHDRGIGVEPRQTNDTRLLSRQNAHSVEVEL